MKKWILFLCSFLITNILNAQFQTSFEATYGGANTGDFGESVIQTADGNLVFVGTTANFGGGGYDIYMVKTDMDGNEIWSNAYGNIVNEVGIGVAELEDGSLICVGNSTASPNPTQIWAAKTDAEGNEIWSKTVGAVNSIAADVVRTTDDGVVIAGDRNGDPYLLKIDAEGILQWDNTLGFGAIEGLEAVEETSDEGFIVIASVGIGSKQEMSLIKTDREGDFEWTSTISEGDVSRLDAHDVFITQDGGYLTMGSIGGGLDAIFLHKTDANGDELWTQMQFVNGENIRPLRIAETANGDLMLVGEGDMYDTDEGTDIFVLKLDKDGAVLLEENYAYGRNESGNGIVLTSSNDLIIAGTSNSFNGSGNDVFGMRISSTGETIWNQTYGGIGNADRDDAFGLLQTADEGYLMSGNSNSFNDRGDSDIYLLKLDEKGEVDWSKAVDFFNGEDICYNIVEAVNGDYGLFGVSSNENGLQGSQLTRIDTEGNVIWHYYFENMLPAFTKGVSALVDGGFVICGRLLTGGVYYAKIDSEGQLVWENNYIGNVAYNIKPTSDGGYVLAGRGNFQQDAESGVYYTPLQVVKVDENGEVLWEYIMGDGTAKVSRAFDIIETISGGLVLVGGRTGETSDVSNLLIAKLDASGNPLWEEELLSEDYSFNNYVVQQTKDNGLMFVGNVGNPGNPLRQGFLLKTDGIGNEKWVRYFGADSGIFPSFYAGLQTEDGGYAMAGSISVNNSTDMYFVKTDELGFIEIVNIFSPQARLSLQLAPNPSQGRFQMTFEGEHIGAVDLTIFDITGRQVFTHSGYKNNLIYHEEMDISDLNSGVYVVEIVSGDKRYSQQLAVK
ncbi:MAG: PQQ-binding-like beta-propeller repeat protein [Chitinophagales bacterium]